MPETNQQIAPAGLEQHPPPKPPGASAFETLYRESRDDLFAYLTYLVGDRALAEELTAEAFERAFRKRTLFKPGRGDLRGWLFAIARNAAVDELRRGGLQTALDFAPEPVADSTAPDDRLFVAEAMRRLQPRDRELVALKFFAGLDNDQIAKVVGISRSNAGTQLHRAMSRLRESIGGADAL